MEKAINNRGESVKAYKKAAILIFVFAVLCSVVFSSCLNEVSNDKKVKVNNVFDQMYNEVIAAKHGDDSILISELNSGEIIADLGVFEGVQVEGPNYKTLVYYNSRVDDIKCLRFLIYKDGVVDDEGKNIIYRYTYLINEQKVYLHNETDGFGPLLETILPDYFKWCAESGEKNPYSMSNLGDVTFEEK